MSTYRQVELPSGKLLSLPVAQTSAAEDVASIGPLSADGLLDALKEFADMLRRAASDAKPDSMDLEFAVGFEVKTGKLTSLLVEGAGNAAVTLTLHWEK